VRVLVTGGARRLGAAIARRLAADGHAVVIHYGRSADDAERLADEIGAAGTVRGDLAALDQVDDLWARAGEAAGGPIDGLVNSASQFEYDRPGRIDPDLATRLHAVNAVAPALLTALLAAQESGGAVVNLLDQKLANPNPDYFSYTLSKAALAQATVLAAQAFAPAVRVNAVAPGLTLPSGDQSEAAFAAVARANLLRRPVGATAVADAVAWLLGATSVTGQTLFVDAGQRFVKSARDVMFDA
jgi:NAD(P)-dependent dehydrogenase (short-subunit alcohol dehydrogenase family)